MSNIRSIFKSDSETLLQFREQALNISKKLKEPTVEKVRKLPFTFEDFKISYDNDIKVSDYDNNKYQNTVIINNGSIVYKNVDKELENIYIADYKSAKEDILDKYCFKKALSYKQNKWVALNAAYNNSGVVVFVPKNTNYEQTLQIIVQQDNSDLVHHSLIILEDNSSLSIIEQCESNDNLQVNIVSETILGSNSQLNYSVIDNFKNNTNTYISRHAVVGRDSSLNYEMGQLNEGNTISEVFVDLNETGSKASINNVAIADSNQKYLITSSITNNAPYTEGYIVNNGVSKDEGHILFNGVGTINNGMKRAISKQESRAIILNDTARADANPFLLIDEYDVEAGHAAAVGRINDEQLFYLMSRGLSKSDAEKLIVYGFLTPLVDSISIESLRETLHQTIAARLNR